MLGVLLFLTYTIEEVDEIGYADKWEDPSVYLPNDAPLHCSIVQVWNVRRADSQVMFDVSLVGVFFFGARHIGKDRVRT